MGISPLNDSSATDDTVEIWSDEQLQEYLSHTVLIDTCVLVDLMVADRPRHTGAIEFYKCVTSLKRRVIIPAHAMFEMRSALTQERMLRNNVQYYTGFTWKRPLCFQIMPIDLKFLELYQSIPVPDLRGGDMVFYVIAKRNGVEFVTEDNEVLLKGKAEGVPVFSLSEFVDKYGNGLDL